MGLFDFLKPNVAPTQTITAIPVNRTECDINKTAIVATLFKTPKEQRNADWTNTFYENVAHASFACATPQLLTGPDGFPYFILNTPEENKPFESFCISNMKDDFLLANGWGVVFNPAADTSTDWVFTYGDIVGFHLENKFVIGRESFEMGTSDFTKTEVVMKKEEHVMIAQPSADYLPYATRNALKLFLQSKGIKKPKVMLMNCYSGTEVIRKLVFNIHPENYPITSQLEYLMQQVGWFLPRHYIMIPLPKRSPLASGFCDL